MRVRTRRFQKVDEVPYNEKAYSSALSLPSRKSEGHCLCSGTFPMRELAIMKQAHSGTPRALSSRRRVLTRFHCFHRHILSLRRIHWSNLSQCVFIDASRKYLTQPMM